MIWGDQSDYGEKMQGKTSLRFGFGHDCVEFDVSCHTG